MNLIIETNQQININEAFSNFLLYRDFDGRIENFSFLIKSSSTIIGLSIGTVMEKSSLLLRNKCFYHGNIRFKYHILSLYDNQDSDTKKNPYFSNETVHLERNKSDWDLD